ncbi:MAG: alpha/beta fold hydrolase [Proteobacteria bacterium]|nr:alpha/beta fold hydrolase [Pseudomonadota bacterium]
MIVIVTLLIAVLLIVRYTLYRSTFKPYNAEDIEYTGLTREYYPNSNGNAIDVVYQKVPKKDYVIIYFHGNSGRSKNTIDYLRKNKHPFISIAYPGYHSSSGKPNIKLTQDSVSLLMNFVKQNFVESERTKIYIVGHSLGSQTALYFASIYHKEISGIVIVNGFASIRQMCEHTLKKYHIQNLCIIAQDYFNGLSYVKNIHLPTYHQFHLENDDVIPYTAGLYIFNKINANSKDFTTLKNGTHHNFPHDDVFNVIVK